MGWQVIQSGCKGVSLMIVLFALCIHIESVCETTLLQKCNSLLPPALQRIRRQLFATDCQIALFIAAMNITSFHNNKSYN